MRQITASEASNDEMERQRFESWFAGYTGFEVFNHPSKNVVEMMWQAWQAALKSKQGEV